MSYLARAHILLDFVRSEAPVFVSYHLVQALDDPTKVPNLNQFSTTAPLATPAVAMITHDREARKPMAVAISEIARGTSVEKLFCDAGVAFPSSSS